MPLDSPRWAELRDVYGPATRIAGLLKHHVDENAEFELSSALCHQGDIKEASYAALPHLVTMQADATNPSPSVAALVAGIENARLDGRGPAIPDDLVDAYFASLRALPELFGARISCLEPADDLMTAMLAAIASSRGYRQYSELLLQMSPETAGLLTEFLENL